MTTVNDKIRITKGAFTNSIGVVDEIRTNGEFVVTINIDGKNRKYTLFEDEFYDMIVVDMLDFENYEFPKPASVSDWEYEGSAYAVILHRIEDKVYETKLAYPLNSARIFNYKEAVKGYRTVTDKLNSMFGTDVVAMYAHETALPTEFLTRLYNRAYSDGHASGYTEVLDRMDDLVRLLNGFQVTAKGAK